MISQEKLEKLVKLYTYISPSISVSWQDKAIIKNQRNIWPCWLQLANDLLFWTYVQTCLLNLAILLFTVIGRKYHQHSRHTKLFEQCFMWYIHIYIGGRNSCPQLLMVARHCFLMIVISASKTAQCRLSWFRHNHFSDELYIYIYIYIYIYMKFAQYKLNYY